MWREHNDPRPARGQDLDDARLEPTDFRVEALDAITRDCLHPESRAELAQAPTLLERAGAALMLLNYFPTRFARGASAASLYPQRAERSPRLDLPFSCRDYDGVVFPE